MKIIFLCGSMEPGRDGVGDYVRRLSLDLISQGQEVSVIALNDKHIKIKEDSLLDLQAKALTVLRIRSGISDSKRFSIAKRFVDDVNPEWISLQFVIFSYHPKGLPFLLNHFLSKIGKGKRWHIMFHELWVGMASDSTKYEKYWGRVQRYLIRSMVRKLKPEIIHTNTGLYKAYLEEMGINANVLSLFSNIPVKEQNEIKNPDIDKVNRSVISLVAFGSIHPGAQIEQLASDVFDYSRRNNIKVTLKLVGNCGQAQYHWLDTWRSKGLEAKLLGEQPPEVISEELKNSDLGITSTPFVLAEKSGSVAAMREHGLPVISISRIWKPRRVKNVKIPSGIVEYNSGNFESYLSIKPNNLLSSASLVSHQMKEALIACV